MISRFILNLRQVNDPGPLSSDNMDLSRLSMPAFAISESRVTGNLGEDLQDIDMENEGINEVDQYSNRDSQGQTAYAMSTRSTNNN